MRLYSILYEGKLTRTRFKHGVKGPAWVWKSPCFELVSKPSVDGNNGNDCRTYGESTNGSSVCKSGSCIFSEAAAASDGGLPILASMGKDLLEHCKTYTNRVRTENERQRIVL